MIPRLTAVLAMAGFLLPVSAPAETASALTNIITLDTRGSGELTVTGRVLDGQSRGALPGATVTLAGSTATSGSNGSFTLANVDLAAGSTMVVSMSGFLPQNWMVTAAAGVKAVNVGDVVLSASTGKPVVESLTLENPRGVYLRGLPQGVRPLLSSPVAKARVNWNGNSPGSVEFRANGVLVGSTSAGSTEYSVTLPVDNYYPSSPDAKRLTVIAKPSGGLEASEPREIQVYVISIPYFIQNFYDAVSTGPGVFAVDLKFPVNLNTKSIPMVGKFGADFELGGSFDYTMDDGSWELAFGLDGNRMTGKRGRRAVIPGLTRYPRPKIYFGNTVIETELYAIAKGSSLTDPFILDQVGGRLGATWKGELTRFSFTDAVLPGLTTGLSYVPGTKALLNNVSIILWGKIGAEGEVLCRPVWPLDFDDLTLNLTAGVEASYEPAITKNLRAKLYAGGEGNGKFGLPAPYFREAGFKLYAGVGVTAYIFEFEREWILVEYTWTADRRLPLNGVHDIGTGYVIEAAANRNATWKPMERPWRESGGEVFLMGPSGPERRLAVDAAESLDVFTRMAKAPAPGAIYVPPSGPGRRIASDPDLPSQAALPLLENVFPDSEPALAAGGDDLMLLYVRDTGAVNPVQFTEVAWTWFDGTSWTAPAAIDADPRGQFEPAVAIDGNGDTVAVWTRIKDAAFSGTELDEMAAQMEVMTATRDSGTGTWSTATALTNNAFLDHKPRLAGPLTDGDLILTWRENQGNLLTGTAASPTRIMTRRWDAATGSWGAAEVLMDSLAGELSDSLAARGDKAVLLLARDLDGDLDDPTDAELFYRIRDEGAGSWGATIRHTTDAIHDRNAKVAIGADGSIYCLWQRGGDLVMDVDFSGSPSLARPDSTSFGFSDISLTVSPAGNVVAIWQEMDEYGSDAHYRVYDPASATWGLDTLLSQDSDLERSFATAWDPMGNLVLAYNNVEVTKQTKSVTLEGGAVIDVEGVPQPGQVDLLLAKRALVNDLGIAEDGLTADGTDYLPGDEITLTARVRNSGNVAVEDVAVSFYNGDPDDGGTLIETVTLPGWLKASEEVEANITWTIPEPAIERTVFAKVDAAGAVTEADEDNNTASLALNGVDLQLEYVSGNVLPDGSVRVVARVRSLSAPESPVTELRLQSEDGTSTWAELEVSQLAPGDSVELPIDLPAGSQPEGDRAYRLVVDEDGLSGDVDSSNNEVLFSLNLWIDEDGDGIPRYWEEANGMSDSDPADADLDLDGDGFSAREEYLAGTDPRDPASRLQIGEIARQATPDGLSTLVSWSSVEGRTYRVQRSYDLDAWMTLADDVAATPPLNTIPDDGIPPDGRAFYRVEVK